MEKETGRLEAFSDGVFAIAMTLLVLELKVPHAAAGGELSAASLARNLLREWPGYLALVTSFFTVLIMWVHHHILFKLVGRPDAKLLFANGFLLLMVSMVPFPTAVVAEYLATPAALGRVRALHDPFCAHRCGVLSGDDRGVSPIGAGSGRAHGENPAHAKRLQTGAAHLLAGCAHGTIQPHARDGHLHCALDLLGDYDGRLLSRQACRRSKLRASDHAGVTNVKLSRDRLEACPTNL